MSKQYIKTEDGVSQVARPKIKVYKSIADLQAAIANGELKEGELVTTEFVDNGGDLSADIESLANSVNEILDQIGDLSGLETKDDATAKLQEAKDYTDEKVGSIDLSPYETKTEAETMKQEILDALPVYTLDESTSTLTITLGS